jgi:hypothetical protein
MILIFIDYSSSSSSSPKPHLSIDQVKRVNNLKLGKIDRKESDELKKRRVSVNGKAGEEVNDKIYHAKKKHFISVTRISLYITRLYKKKEFVIYHLLSFDLHIETIYLLFTCVFFFICKYGQKIKFSGTKKVINS